MVHEATLRPYPLYSHLESGFGIDAHAGFHSRNGANRRTVAELIAANVSLHCVTLFTLRTEHRRWYTLCVGPLSSPRYPGDHVQVLLTPSGYKMTVKVTTTQSGTEFVRGSQCFASLRKAEYRDFKAQLTGRKATRPVWKLEGSKNLAFLTISW